MRQIKIVVIINMNRGYIIWQYRYIYIQEIVNSFIQYVLQSILNPKCRSEFEQFFYSTKRDNE